MRDRLIQRRSRPAGPDVQANGSRAGQPAGDARRRSRGQSMVEFALIVPFFFVIFAAIISFGLALFWNMSLINATREAARQGSITLKANEIPTVVATSLTSGAGNAGLNPSYLGTPVITCVQMNVKTTRNPCDWSQWTPTNTIGAEKGDAVNVVASYTIANPFPLSMKVGNTTIGLPASFTLTSTVQFTLDGAINGS